MRPRPKLDDSPLWVEGVAALVLIGELAPLTIEPFIKSPLLLGSTVGFNAAACPTQKSQRAHPRIVPALPQLTTETGETRCW